MCDLFVLWVLSKLSPFTNPNLYDHFWNRYIEKGNIEAQFFNIQAKLKANGQKMYTPPEGQLIHDIESAWICLEKAEHEREVALRDEMIR